MLACWASSAGYRWPTLMITAPSSPTSRASRPYRQNALGDAAAAIEGGNVVQGLADTFSGLDDTTVSPEEWLLLGGSDALTGAALPGSGWFDFDDTLIAPTNWSDALTDTATLTSLGNDFLTAASDAFTGGDPSTGLSDLLIAGDFFGNLAHRSWRSGWRACSPSDHLTRHIRRRHPDAEVLGCPAVDIL